MKIVLSKLPESGWWRCGIPQYKDNPAMKKGQIPINSLLVKERDAIIKAIQEEGHEIIELDFPKQLDSEKPNHDFVFIRDPFISNQNGKAIILRAGEPTRRVENEVIKELLEQIQVNICEMPNRSGWRADGGEFFYCANNRVLFSGLQRNTQKGVDFVAEELNVNEVVLLKGEGFHLDTFFTPALNKDGYIAALIICEKFLNPQSKKTLFNYADTNDIPVFIIPKSDALGTKVQAGRFAVNALPLPGILLRPNYFSNPAIDEQLGKLGIKTKITPTSQFQLSGGSVHCVTNEL
tara:strand:- start:1293 stop:2171 length:879 start_codon:yes stop_codon:yes gene_type:complete